MQNWLNFKMDIIYILHKHDLATQFSFNSNQPWVKKVYQNN